MFAALIAARFARLIAIAATSAAALRCRSFSIENLLFRLGLHLRIALLRSKPLANAISLMLGPILAGRAAPARPATTMAVSSGPSSRSMARPTRSATKTSPPKTAPPTARSGCCRDSTNSTSALR